MLIAKLRIALIIFFLIVIAANIPALYWKCQEIRTGALDPEIDPGLKLADLPQYLKDEHVIGYFTDWDFSPESPNTRNFLSAQYQLAPIVLDVDKKHKINLIDTTSLPVAMRTMEKLQTTPIYLNPYGKLLAQIP